MALEIYHRKRNFKRTAEPRGAKAADRKRHDRFVIQEHHASHLHFDLRLEMDGVLKSWAVPKGPSLDPKVRRLAVMTEDHPVRYLSFEGHIPEGNYGAGDMAIWDSGTYTTPEEPDPVAGLDHGKLVVHFEGSRLHGDFHLVHLKDDEHDNQWLLIKAKDEFADENWRITSAVAADGTPVARTVSGQTAAKSPGPHPPAGLGVRAKFPASVHPMLTTLVDTAPQGEEWVFEVKWDGFRAVAFIQKGQARLISRNGTDLTPLFPTVAEELAKLDCKAAVLDGEIVALNDEGRPSFQLLQNATGTRYGVKGPRQSGATAKPPALVFYAFDLLHRDGKSLAKNTLLERKAALQALLAKTPRELVNYSEHFVGPNAGQELLDHAAREGLEGILAKRADGRYEERRSAQWLKIKLQRQMDAVILGYTAPRGERKAFGSLILGIYRADRLQYIGHTGTGFGRADLEQLLAIMHPLRQTKCPVDPEPETNDRPTWLRPALVCEVKYGQITADGRLRHPVFLGLRADKAAADCHWEVAEPVTEIENPSTSVKSDPGRSSTVGKKNRAPVSAASDRGAPQSQPKSSRKRAAGRAQTPDVLLEPQLVGDITIRAGEHILELTHLDKPYWPADGLTKGDLLRYYFRMAEVILPYLRDRPLILKRYPSGIDGQFFFQHNNPQPPAFATTFLNHEDGEEVRYLVCNNLATLLYMANLGSIALNPWLARTQSIGKPDWLIFDIDPGDDVPFGKVCDLALTIRDCLSKLKLKGYAKTSGAAGMHVYVPLEARYSFDQVRDFGILVSELVQRARPDLTTIERSIKKRPAGTSYLDVMQNNLGKSVAGVWSVREQPGATVSTPLTWDEVQAGPDRTTFNINTVPDRVTKSGDNFAAILNAPQPLEPALNLLEPLLAKPIALQTGRRGPTKK